MCDTENFAKYEQADTVMHPHISKPHISIDIIVYAMPVVDRFATYNNL
jgi:hypothetical protein